MSDIDIAKKFLARYGGKDGNNQDLAYSLSRWLDWDLSRSLKALNSVKE